MIIKKNGFTLLGLLMTITFIGVIAVYGSQIGLGYVEKETVRGAVKSALMDAKIDDYGSVKKVREAIFTKLLANTFELTQDEIDVERKDGHFLVTVSHFKEIKVTKDITLVMDLSFEEETQGTQVDQE